MADDDLVQERARRDRRRYLAAMVTTIALPVLTLTMAMWWADIGEGSGGIGIFSSGTELVLLPAIAFTLGFWWSIRRARRKRTVTGT
jgi:hypothetical protein